MSATLTQAAEMIMDDFIDRTHISGAGECNFRYLWTDAFAVRNLLSLYRFTKHPRYLETPLRLVDSVHHTLGRHQDDDPRSGWISGLDGNQAEQHPTIGGLRIGKPLVERAVDEPYSENIEWERDGQYFHYLTKWMDALNEVAIVTGDRRYNGWAIELARTAHSSFVYVTPGGSQADVLEDEH